MDNIDAAGMGQGGYPAPHVPRLSLAERDRRWAAVRALMMREDIDVLVTFSHSGWWDTSNANTRYLTCIGGNCAPLSAVFPQAGDVTVIGGPAPKSDYWIKAQDWVVDVRTNFFDMTAMLLDRLDELFPKPRRIGVLGLDHVPRQPDGLVSTGALRRLRERFPESELVDATQLVAEVRVVKSPEEIEMLRQSVIVVEKAFDVLAAEARPGAPECVVYGRMAGNMIENGSEPTSMFLWTAGNPLPPTVSFIPSRRPLGPDDIILIEMESRWGGYNGQGTITHWVGEPDDTDRKMAALQYEAFLRCCKAMRPGVPFGVLVDVCAQTVQGTPYQCKPIVHGRGHGMDGPVLVYEARDTQTANWPIAENSVFILKPNISLPDGSKMIMWGDSVVVSPSGAERLGTRLPPLIEQQSFKTLGYAELRAMHCNTL